jgi:hypothetical protein
VESWSRGVVESWSRARLTRWDRSFPSCNAYAWMYDPQSMVWSSRTETSRPETRRCLETQLLGVLFLLYIASLFMLMQFHAEFA